MDEIDTCIVLFISLNAKNKVLQVLTYLCCTVKYQNILLKVSS